MDNDLPGDETETVFSAYRIGHSTAVREIRAAIKRRDVTMQITRDELMEILDEVEG